MAMLVYQRVIVISVDAEDRLRDTDSSNLRNNDRLLPDCEELIGTSAASVVCRW